MIDGNRFHDESNLGFEILRRNPIQFRCECSSGYTGEICNEIASFNTTTTTTSTTSGGSEDEIKPSCIEHQCHNKGQCHVTKASNYRPFCECSPGYSGEHCELLEPNTINVDGEESRVINPGQREIVEPKGEEKMRSNNEHGTGITVYVLIAILFSICAALVAFRFHDAICKSIQRQVKQ